MCAATADSLSSTPTAASTMETPENTENEPGDPEPVDGDIKIEYSSD